MKTIYLIALISILLPLSATAFQWHEVQPSQYSTLYIYQGPSYPDQAFKQQSQSLGVNISEFGAGLIQGIKYRLNGTGSWTTINVNTWPWVELGTLTEDIGVHTLNLAFIPYNGTTWYTNHHMFVVPNAYIMYEDGNGNSMEQWGQSGSEQDPVLLVEGFDPENKSMPNYYYAAGELLTKPLTENG